MKQCWSFLKYKNDFKKFIVKINLSNIYSTWQIKARGKTISSQGIVIEHQYLTRKRQTPNVLSFI